jgi:type I restriction enzyme S subunit
MSLNFRTIDSLLNKSGADRAGNRDYPVLSITMRDGLVDQSEKFKKRVASQDTTKYRIAYHNELVVGFPIDEGVLGFQTKYPAGIVSPAYDIWKLKDPAATYIPYLERYLRSTQARRIYASKMQGAVARRRSLTKEDFLKLEIPFPPIDDQKRIAHLLGKVEGLIAQRKQNLQQLDDLLKSVFLEMFGDPLRNEMGWIQDRIGRSTKVQGGYAFKSKDLVNKGAVRVVKISNVHSEKLIWDDVSFVPDHYYNDYSRFALFEGDLLIALTRPVIKSLNVVKTATVRKSDMPCLLNQRVARFVLDENQLKKRFLLQFCYTQFFKDTVEKLCPPGLQPNISTNQIEDITIYYPPIDLQNQFAIIAEKVEGLKPLYQQILADLESLYSALSQKAFKGELDLSRVAVTLEQKESTEEVETEIATVTEISVKPAIELPTPAVVADLTDADGRMKVIGMWLDSYLEQLRDLTFSAQDFMERAQQKLWELLEDDTYQLSVAEYDHVKDLIFKAIETGRLTQGYNDDKNLVQITAARG